MRGAAPQQRPVASGRYNSNIASVHPEDLIPLSPPSCRSSPWGNWHPSGQQAPSLRHLLNGPKLSSQLFYFPFPSFGDCCKGRLLCILFAYFCWSIRKYKSTSLGFLLSSSRTGSIAGAFDYSTFFFCLFQDQVLNSLLYSPWCLCFLLSIARVTRTVDRISFRHKANCTPRRAFAVRQCNN